MGQEDGARGGRWQKAPQLGRDQLRRGTGKPPLLVEAGVGQPQQGDGFPVPAQGDGPVFQDDHAGVLQPGFEGRILRQPGLVVARDEVSGGKFGGPCGKGKGPGQVGAPGIHQVSGQHNEVGLGLGEGLQEAAVLFSEGCVVQV